MNRSSVSPVRAATWCSFINGGHFIKNLSRNVASQGVFRLHSRIRPDLHVRVSFPRIYRRTSFHHASSGLHSALYDSLPLGETSIRLLRILAINDEVIECALTVSDISCSPDYIALSYTWGPPTREAAKAGMTADRSRSILCNGQKLAVTENLFDFLLRCSRTRGLETSDHESIAYYYWVDAVCINQEDVKEKAAQVPKMAKIYSACKRVFIWLGKEDKSSAKALALIRGMEGIPFDSFVSSGLLDRDSSSLQTVFGRDVTWNDWQALARFFRRSWFNRVWIVQEVVLAARLGKPVRVLCGRESFAWELLVHVSTCMALSNWKTTLNLLARFELGLSRLARKPSSTYFPGTMPFMLKAMASNSDSEKKLRLSDYLQVTRLMEATLKYDHVYGVLGLDGNAIPVSYEESLSVVFLTTARYIIETTQDLSILSNVEDMSMRSINGLPSWVPDWTAPHASIAGIIHGDRFYAASEMGQTPRIHSHGRMLAIRGVCLDTVAHIADFFEPYGGRNMSMSWSGVINGLELVHGAEQRYITGQSRVEAFWRTLTLDIDPNGASDLLMGTLTQHHSPPPKPSKERVNGLWAYIRTAAERSVGYGAINEGDLLVLDALAQEDSRIPSSKEIYESARQHVRTSMDFVTHCCRVMHWLCQTNQGFFGRCPMSTIPGDEVWIIPGCNVPIILRKTSSSGQYRLIGDAYIHGFMFGEALNRNLEFMDIAIE